jgi:hypothetical protein
MPPMSFHSFIHQSLYSPLLGPALFSFVIFFTQIEGLPGQVISLPQGRYLHTEQHKHRIKVYTDIHALSGIRTHDPSVRGTEDSSCLRPRGHCRRPNVVPTSEIRVSSMLLLLIVGNYEAWRWNDL